MGADCTKQSVLYENICARCVPKARGKGAIRGEDINLDIPSIYVGESSRSVVERMKEHWSSYKGRKEDSHMFKHQVMEHQGEEADFVVRVEGTFKTALTRQISEAVRIRRRGGMGSI